MQYADAMIRMRCAYKTYDIIEVHAEKRVNFSQENNKIR